MRFESTCDLTSLKYGGLAGRTIDPAVDVTIDGFDCFFVALAVDWPPHIGCLSMKRNPYTRLSEVYGTPRIQGRNMRQGRCHRKSNPAGSDPLAES